MIYLSLNKEKELRVMYPELFTPDNLTCICGELAEEVRGWISLKHIGIEAISNCDCGRGKLSVSTARGIRK